VTNNLPAVVSQPNLAALAATIRKNHESVARAAEHIALNCSNMIAFALDAGDALIAAKAAVGHGRWLPWLKKECDLSSRQAERYMTLARGRKTLDALRGLRRRAIDAIWMDLDPRALAAFTDFSGELITRLEAYAARQAKEAP